MKLTKPHPTPHGTKEWAKYSLNIQDGCEHNCKYCYAKTMAIRFKRSTAKTWEIPRTRPDAVTKSYSKRHGRIMFPTSHDITEQNFNECVVVLKKLLKANNEFLIVSKPHPRVFQYLCSELISYREQIMFRFSIGSSSDQTLGFWEPNAPTFSDRLQSLQLVFNAGFETSVSCEPMLDRHIGKVITAVKPFVTDSIWLGKANRLRSIVPMNCPDDSLVSEAMEQLISWQSNDAIISLYNFYKNDPIIRWKDSIKKIVGIPQPRIAGMDI